MRDFRKFREKCSVYCLVFLLIAVCITCAPGEKTSSEKNTSGDQKPERNILLITIDTLRADHLQSYGYNSIKTPVESKLAGEGVRFENAVTPVPLTLPAHASILTGLYPPEHGVRDNGKFYLEDKIKTLPERLKESGYRTGAFVGAFVLDSQFGLNQGFDIYEDNPAEMEKSRDFLFAERKAEKVGQKALD